MTPKPHLPGTPRRTTPKQPAPRGRLWVVLLAPLTSRGSYSPRLHMAWVLLAALLWLLWRWMEQKPQVLNGVLVPVRDIDAPMGILAGLISSLILYGTYQKVKLGDAAPSPGENETNGQV